MQRYLYLVDILLDSPSGKEKHVLREHPDLLGDEFLSVVQDYAEYLDSEGQHEAAERLQGLIQYIQENGSHDLGSGPPFLSEDELQVRSQFLRQLMSTVTAYQGDPRDAYDVLDRHGGLIDEATVEIFSRDVTGMIQGSESDEESHAAAALVLNIGNVLTDYPRGPRTASLEWAIAAYEAALNVFTRRAAPYDWAGTQMNLATAYRRRIRGDRADNLEHAIAAYETVLAVFTRKAAPHDWAGVKNNLGSAYQERIRGDRADNLEHAIAAYEAALGVSTRKAAPYDWAKIQNNLGIAYRGRIRGDRADNLEHAIAAYEAALKVFTRKAAPQKWATIQSNLGAAYQERIRGDRADNLEHAIAAFEAALNVYIREAAPHNWAGTQNNLGTAYRERIRGERADNLERAIEACEAALGVFTREAEPHDWAKTQMNLGAAYQERIRGDRADNLEHAIAAFEAALNVYTREAAPHDWAGVKNNFGIAYRKRIRGERADNLEHAIAAFEAALNVYTREAAPHNWAGVKNNLGIAYRERIRGERADNLERAIEACEAALGVFTREAAPHDWAKTQMNLGAAYAGCTRGDRADNVEHAIAAFEAALSVFTREAAPHDWAGVKNNLGNAYRWRIRGDRADNLERAIAAYGSALEIYRPDTYPVKTLMAARNLAGLLEELERWSELRKTLRIAIEAIEAARDEAIDDERRKEIIEKAIDVYAVMVETCLQTERPREALAYAEQSRSRTLADLLHGRDLSPSANVPPELLKEDAQLQRRIRELRTQFSAARPGGDGPSGLPTDFSIPSVTISEEHHLDIEKELRNTVRRRHDVMAQIGEHDPAYRQSLAATPVEYSDVADFSTERNTAVIEWYQTADQMHAFVIVPGGNAPEVVTLKMDAWKKAVGTIAMYLDGYEHLWTQNTDGLNLGDILKQLSADLLLGDILAKIPDSYRSVLLIPHRVLHLLPFPALPVGKSDDSDTLLIDRFSDGIRNAPSTLIARMTTERDRQALASFWAVEDPTGDLPYAKMEVANVRRHFPRESVSVHANERATRSALTESGGFLSSHCNHFACHGRFDPQNPLRSSLSLAGEEELTLGDIFEYRLSASRLSVLSACESGLTDIRSLTDDYVGLPSGFLFAGSQAVVSSLWRVADISTSILMMSFYDEVAKQREAGRAFSVSKALREAQNWLRTAIPEELEQWIDDREGLSDSQRHTLKLEIYRPVPGTNVENYPPFSEPIHWAAFHVLGD